MTLHQQKLKKKQHTTLTIIEKETTHYTNNIEKKQLITPTIIEEDTTHYNKND